MRYAVFADIHGNLEALEAVLGELQGEELEGLICAGDTVGYGADPNECIKKVRDFSVLNLAGNHDWAAVGKTDIGYFNQKAGEVIAWTKNKLTKENKEYLESLPLLIERDTFQLVHSSLNQPAYWNYIYSFFEAKDTFLLMKKNLLFIAHTHVPIIFFLSQGRVGYSFATHLRLKEGVKYIINVGSIGQPRDGDPRACYLLFDDKKREIIFKRVSYPIGKAQEKIRKAGLPEIEAARLAEGR